MCPLLETAYWPPIAWLSALWPCKRAAIEACEHYQKGSWRNRCHIAGPNGPQRLSVPLEKGKHRQTAVREVKIAYDEPWQQQHWRSIRTAYGNAPYFEHYESDLAHFYEKRYTFLFDLNWDLLQFWLRKTAWPGQLQTSQEFYGQGQWLDGTDYRGAFSVSDAAYPEGFTPLPYPQVFAEKHGFTANLSGLDLLMCVGKHSGEWLIK